MSTHTPGPWVAGNASNGRIFGSWGVFAHGKRIATVKNGPDVANAHLIAAAPAMLEALIQVQAVLGDLVRADGASIDEIEAYSAVKEAIRLAEGRP